MSRQTERKETFDKFFVKLGPTQHDPTGMTRKERRNMARAFAVGEFRSQKESKKDDAPIDKAE